MPKGSKSVKSVKSNVRNIVKTAIKKKVKKEIAKDLRLPKKKNMVKKGRRAQGAYRNSATFSGGGGVFREKQPGEKLVIPRVAPGPTSMTYGPCDRMVVDFASLTVGRSGAAGYTNQNQIFAVMNNSNYHYRKVVTCNPNHTSTATTSNQICAWCPEITSESTIGTRTQILMKWHNRFVVRELYFDYIPTKNKMTDGTLVFAPVREYIETGPEEATFMTICGVAGAVRVPVCEKARIWVVRPMRMGVASEFVQDMDVTDVSQASLIGAVDTTLSSGSDTLGTLEGHMVIDMYGARGLAQTTALTKEQRLLRDLQSAGIDVKKIMKQEEAPNVALLSSSTSSSTDCRFTAIVSKDEKKNVDEKKMIDDYVILRSKQLGVGNHA
jgi:hypothetical protein